MARDYDPGPPVAHAGNINFDTLDLARPLCFFSDLLGMEVVAPTDTIADLLDAGPGGAFVPTTPSAGLTPSPVGA